MAKRQETNPKPSLFGMHAVVEAWLNPDRAVKALYVTQQAADAFSGQMKGSGRRPPKDRPKPMIVNKQELEKMLPRGAVHQGLALAASPLPETDVQDLIIKAANQNNSTIVMLDQVKDPHNVGAIIRSASALGASGIVMQRKHAPELTGVLAKTACGAIEHIPTAFETNLSRTLETFKEAGYFAYGLDERGETPLRNIKPGGKSVLVLGAEGPGMRRLVREHCDALIRLPTAGAISSLNVSNAAAVALYQFCEN